MPQPLKDRILQYLDHKKGSCDTLELYSELDEDHQHVIGAIKSLECYENLLNVSQKFRIHVEVTAEGKQVAERGSHEAIVFRAVPPGSEGIPADDLMINVESKICKIGLSKAIANGWLKITKDVQNVARVIRLVDDIEDNVMKSLKTLVETKGDASKLDLLTAADLKKRKLLTRIEVSYLEVSKGSKFSLEIIKYEVDLTPEMLSNKSWKQKKFKPYNFNCLGAPINSGHLHPLLKMRSEIRSILLEMGFIEMSSNQWVESAFWNFDALFVPQKHPARDVQDTFFMSQPKISNLIPVEYMERVKAAHTGQDYETFGYGPDWREEETRRNCLRTHTTSISARMLNAIAVRGKDFKPIKLFSVDRVYRNETLDHTHLAEFFQVEGIIADYNINLGNLISVLREFFSRLGLINLRFKPAYNPYTEPSMEVFGYHNKLRKWIEIGNSGMFRPEVLLPMGLPKDIRVVAWGLSLERPTMIRYGIENIRELVGHKVNLRMVYDSPMCGLI